jgi:membrane protease YdiL (CAAX protease family)
MLHFVDPLPHWRGLWQKAVSRALVTELSGPTDALASQTARWRGLYGTYRGVTLDLIIIAVLQVVLIGVAVLATGASIDSPTLVPVVVLVSEVSILLYLGFRLAIHSLTWTLVGLGSNQIRTGMRRALVYGTLIGIANLCCSDLLVHALGGLGISDNLQYDDIIAPLLRGPGVVALAAALLGTFLAPFAEELFLRGYIFRALAIRKGFARAFWISALIFALLHGEPGLAPVFFVSGLLLCYAYFRTGNLLASMTAHAINNGFAFAVALAPHFLPH